MKRFWQVVFIVAIAFNLLLWGNYGFWVYIHAPIDRRGFQRGVSVGMALTRCGVIPTDKLIDDLSHFVDGDEGSHNCLLLKARAK